MGESVIRSATVSHVGGVKMSWLQQWWTEPDQFDTVTKFLRERDLLRQGQRIMAVICGSSLAVLVPALFYQPSLLSLSTLAQALSALFILAMTVYWLRHWPTRRQSQAAIVTGTLCVAVFSIVQPNATLGAQAPTALAVTGAYIAFFHNARLILWNTLLAVTITTLSAFRLASTQDIPTAVATFWLVFFLNLAMPVAIGALAKAMGTYALRASEDPLTGLLNRRGFVDALRSLRADSSHPEHTYLTALLIDLDAFKEVNDTRGHAAGDRALITVAALLRQHCPPHSIIARSGGEEFVIAVTSPTSDAGPLAVRLCEAIAMLPDGITASIGAATVRRSAVRGNPGVEVLIADADTAMYAAKRKGGNQVHLA